MEQHSRPRRSCAAQTIAALAVLAFLAVLPAGVFALDITTCGTVVPKTEVGVLQADLDCGGLDGVVLRRRATLDMNGHSISNATSAVSCDNGGKGTRCKVTGPGSIDSSAFGVRTVGKTKLTISDVTVTGCEQGIYGESFRMTLIATNVEASDNVQYGIRSGGARAKLTNVVANGNGQAGVYIFGGKAINVTANDNQWGFITAKRRFRGTDITTNDNTETGFRSFHSLRVAGLQSHGNGRGGLMHISGGTTSSKKPIRLANASVTGNLFMGTPADIISVRTPKVDDVTCEYSWGFLDDGQPDLLPPLGICSND